MSSLVKALRPFASCDIGDALVKLGVPLGGYINDLRMFSPHRAGDLDKKTPTMIGEAVTVKMVRADDTESPRPEKHFADANEAGKVMFISQPPSMYSACFGGLMAARAKKLGAAGVVVNGRFRDIEEIQDMGLPLFAREQSILGSNSFTRASEINVPVKARRNAYSRSYLWINPGDLLVGDKDGVVCVSPSLVDQVVQLCQERKEIDEKTLAALAEGMSMGEALAKFRK
ncbi:RraA-like protein [Pseudovirgaria hyperparasitica]|uniref:RraA-like protein n=1 Tax=Pseudovirgaria hyperparasitica TaxID=470096 RepID=A0A6A6WMU3_9PEZI|nr:RraA-like protein [Pseudovirgaria hyperparasitica]KAF2763544.1 RraA-like protein [Pseudovirgaria hyperparasitica]